MNLPISFVEIGFVFASGGTPEDLKDAIVSALQGNVDGDNILLGKIGGSQPTDGRIWLNNGTWHFFDGSQYRPVLVKVGTAAHQITLIADPIANRSQTLQDKSGTIALTSDIYTPRPTELIASPDYLIDWSRSNSFYRELGVANTVFTMSNSLPGQEIDLIVYVASGAKTAAFPSNVNWIGGTQGAQTSPGTDKYHFSNIAGQIFGEHSLDYA